MVPRAVWVGISWPRESINRRRLEGAGLRQQAGSRAGRGGAVGEHVDDLADAERWRLRAFVGAVAGLVADESAGLRQRGLELLAFRGVAGAVESGGQAVDKALGGLVRREPLDLELGEAAVMDQVRVDVAGEATGLDLDDRLWVGRHGQTS